MAPLHLLLMLHYYVHKHPYPKASVTSAEYESELAASGLLTRHDSANEDGSYSITPKGEAWVEKALATPMPTQKWGYE